ncbi:MAG: DUF4157 domain-containing protein [Anaerolineae bacterium]|nr:DUF4157 domain-containing protein [Anaerolineae bacterium]
MGNSGQITQADKKSQRKIQPPAVAGAGSGSIANLMPEIGPAFNGPSVEAQAEMLNRLPTAQGQTVATKIGETQGNRHLQRVMTSLKNTPVQTKLTVSEPGDEYELEADNVAEQVMKMPAPATPPPPPTDGDDDAGGEDPRNRNRPAALNRYVQRSPIQRSSDGIGGNEVDSGVESRIQNMQRGGTPMPQTERNFFESRMGVDLSNVKVHNDSEAAATSEELNAQAYTVGSNIAFGAGKYAPGTTAGRRLMAHELTHVVQQGGAGELQRKVGERKPHKIEIGPDDAPNASGSATQPGMPRVGDGKTNPPGSKNGAGGIAANPPEGSSEAPDKQQEQGMASSHAGKLVDSSEQHHRSEKSGGTKETTDKPAPESPSGTQDTPSKEASSDTKKVETQSDQKPEPQKAEMQAETAGSETEKTTGNEESAPEQNEATADKDQTGAETAKADAETESNMAPEGANQEQSADKSDDSKTKTEPALFGKSESHLKEAESHREAAIQQREQSTARLEALSGKKAIIPQTAMDKLGIDDMARDEALSLNDVLPTPKREFGLKPDMFIQRTPDLTIQRQPGPQITPESITVPELKIDTTPITAAATAAKAAPGFDQKIATIAPLVAISKLRVMAIGLRMRSGLLGKYVKALAQLETDAGKAKDNIDTEYDTQVKALKALESGIPDKVSGVIQGASTRVDEVVKEFADKCHDDANDAIESYCARTAKIEDDGTWPPFGPGEEKGYHQRKADTARETALKVGSDAAESYRENGDQVKEAFRGDVSKELTTSMQNEIAGMQQALDTARTDAYKEVDKTKNSLRQQTTKLYGDAQAALKKATSDTIKDLTDYGNNLTEALKKAKEEFEAQVDTAEKEAIAQAETALAEAQKALAQTIEKATAPGRILKPGAQEAINEAAADIQAQLNKQVTSAASQITGIGSSMTGIINGIDITSACTSYASTFEQTAGQMLQQISNDGFDLINKNLVDFGVTLQKQASVTFEFYVKASEDSLQEIEDAAGPNLIEYVENEFKPAIANSHEEMKKQAKIEGEKAGEDTQPAWKGWVKIIINVVIAVVVVVAIGLLVALTGGILLGVLIGAAIGAAGGLIKCLAFNALDGKPPFENVGSYVVEGAINGAITGLTAGLIGPTGIFLQGSGVGTFFLRTGLDVTIDTIKDGISNIAEQLRETGTVDFGELGKCLLMSFAINAATAGLIESGKAGWSKFKGVKGGADLPSGKPNVDVPGGKLDVDAPGGNKIDLPDGKPKVDMPNGGKMDGDAGSLGAWTKKPPKTKSEIAAYKQGLPPAKNGYRWNMSKNGKLYQQKLKNNGWKKPPRTKSEIEAYKQGNPPAEDGYCWSMSKKGKLYQRKLPKSNKKGTSVPGVPGPKEGTPPGPTPNITPPGPTPNVAPPDGPVPVPDPNFTPTPTRPGESDLELGWEGANEGLQTLWKDYYFSTHNLNTYAPNTNIPEPNANVNSGNNTTASHEYTVPTPTAPNVTPGNWNFDQSSSVAPINVPQAPNDYNFDPNNDSYNTVNDISTGN